jgi:hypothetical protein
MTSVRLKGKLTEPSLHQVHRAAHRLREQAARGPGGGAARPDGGPLLKRLLGLKASIGIPLEF